MAFNTSTQLFQHDPNMFKECGSYTFAESETSGPDLSLPTKLKRIKGGFGITADGVVCIPTIGQTSAGRVTFTRCGTWIDTTPTMHYVLWGE